MSVKIHHGPHGSYKTSGAVKDDLIPAIKEGRPIITNLRGISLERIYDAFPDAPPSLELYHCDTETQAGLDHLRKFFHWAPENSFIFIDEAQIVFPKSWRESDIRALDHPDGIDACFARNRPPTWEHCWDMERQFNFDMVLTTPNIKKIREDIRTNAEGAFKHKNNAIYGAFFGGSYIEGFHLADDNGTSQSDFQSIVRKRIKKDEPVWHLYDSTKTGQHRDTKAGINLLASPRLLLPLGVLALAAGFALFNGAPAVLSDSKSIAAPLEAPKASTHVPARQNPRPLPAADPDRVGHFQDAVVRQVEKQHPFDGSIFRLVGLIEAKGKQKVFFEIDGVFATSDELAKLGYTFDFLTGCAVAVHHKRSHLLVTCTPIGEEEKKAEDAPKRDSPSLNTTLAENQAKPPDVPVP